MTAPTEPPAAAEPQQPPEGQQPEPETFSREYVENLRKENAKYRTKAAENSDAAKTAELARHAAMSDAERAVAEAESRGRTAAAAEYGQRLARSDFVAASARRNAEFDAAAVLDDLNLARFVGEDGEPDTAAIGKAVERLVPELSGPPRPPSFDGGARSPAPATAGMNGLIRKAVGRA